MSIPSQTIAPFERPLREMPHGEQVGGTRQHFAIGKI